VSTQTTDLTTAYIERRAKFKKRAESNLNKKVLDGLRQLGRCANRKIYAYDEQQVETMISQIELALAEMKKAYATDAGETKGRWVEL
jgi:hypothetical protein